ncbi:hypothetical protein Gorai_002497, partial [Gossypium raimondii]|nr:hypothetical protein [Gossypium raimondii]
QIVGFHHLSQILAQTGLFGKEASWKLSWKFKGPQRVRVFIWLSLKQRLLTNAEKTKRGIGMGPACRICGHEISTINNLMLSWEELIGNAYLRLLSDAFRIIGTFTSFKPSRSIVIPLPNSWISLNTDGLVRAKDAFAATSGILCDQSRRWIIGFNRYLDNCVVLNSKLSGISGGLKLTLDGKKVLIQTNSLEAVNIIQVSDRESSNLA